MQKAFSLVKTILTLGWFGDFNVLREMALKCTAFKYIYYLFIEKHQSYFPLSVEVVGYVKFYHFTGIHVTAGAKIGKQCILFQHVTIGRITNVAGGANI